jgi:hypothetical protein
MIALRWLLPLPYFLSKAGFCNKGKKSIRVQNRKPAALQAFERSRILNGYPLQIIAENSPAGSV